MLVVAALALAASAFAGTYTVVEPPPKARRITLQLVHPRAAKQVVASERVERMTVGELRARMKARAGLWADASLDCEGGYNPTARTGGLDYLGFSIATPQREADVLAQFTDDRTVHEVCMAQALQLADRLSRTGG